VEEEEEEEEEEGIGILSKSVYSRGQPQREEVGVVQDQLYFATWCVIICWGNLVFGEVGIGLVLFFLVFSFVNG
jgi:hypothetical protein